LVAYTHEAKALGDCIFGKGRGKRRQGKKKRKIICKRKNKIKSTHEPYLNQ